MMAYWRNFLDTIFPVRVLFDPRMRDRTDRDFISLNVSGENGRLTQRILAREPDVAVSLAKELFGFERRTPFEEGLRRTIERREAKRRERLR